MTEDEKIRALLLELADLADVVAVKLRQTAGETKPSSGPTVDVESLPWVEVPALTNPKGPWQLAKKSDAPAFKALAEIILKSGKKAMFYKGANYWILPDGAIGRRAVKKGDGQK